jgi:hypothetical protein
MRHRKPILAHFEVDWLSICSQEPGSSKPASWNQHDAREADSSRLLRKVSIRQVTQEEILQEALKDLRDSYGGVWWSSQRQLGVHNRERRDPQRFPY